MTCRELLEDTVVIEDNDDQVEEVISIKEGSLNASPGIPEVAEGSSPEENFVEVLMEFPLNVQIQTGTEYPPQSDDDPLQDTKVPSEEEHSKYICQICKESFKTASALLAHRVSHALDETFQCPRCADSFATESHLMEHMKSHKRGDVLSCRLCGSAFNNTNLVRQHIKLIHLQHLTTPPVAPSGAPAEDNPKTDEVRDLRSSRQLHSRYSGKTIISHFLQSRADEPIPILPLLGPKIRGQKGRKIVFKCEYCGRIWDCKSKLEKHKVSHRDDRPHHCSDCLKSFKLREQLAVHRVVHATQRARYRCSICQEAYCNIYVLRSHLKKKHKISHTTRYERRSLFYITVTPGNT
ncbi:zinc finger protein 257-like [Lutzomyia longipalpis]|uniref:zinc finger protein 257-like n=1 Tax=Lutzomyia longipalpis TaxID=7200 RepID=UPI0024844297|nr:zinc finger protein 257-like [Lutzomyia longipalpis]